MKKTIVFMIITNMIMNSGCWGSEDFFPLENDKSAEVQAREADRTNQLIKSAALGDVDAYNNLLETSSQILETDPYAAKSTLFNLFHTLASTDVLGFSFYKSIQVSLIEHTNEAEVQYFSGNFYLSGYNVDKDVSEAIRLYTLSANQGNIHAARTLAKIYYRGLFGEAKKLLQARSYLEFIATFGDSWAQKILQELPQDPDFQFELGLAYYEGNGVTRDFSKAEELWTSSQQKMNINAIQKLNDPEVQYKFGVMYLTGDEVIKNAQKAKAYLDSSASQKYTKAISLLQLEETHKYADSDSSSDVEYEENDIEYY